MRLILIFVPRHRGRRCVLDYTLSFDIKDEAEFSPRGKQEGTESVLAEINRDGSYRVLRPG